MRPSPGYWLQGALFVAAAFLLGQWAETERASRSYQRNASAIFERVLRVEKGDPGAATSGLARVQARRTGVVGRLRIPRLGLSAMVGEGVDDRTLGRAIGHIPSSAFPGEMGNVSLAGHRDTFLRKLNHIRTGDRIEIVTADGVFGYRVVRARVVSPYDTKVLLDTGEPLLTIVTCYPFHAIGPAPERFVVHARRDDSAAKLSSS